MQREEDVNRTNYGGCNQGTVKKKLIKRNEDSTKQEKNLVKEPLSKAFDSEIVFDDGGREKIVKFRLLGPKNVLTSEKELTIVIDLYKCLDEGGFSQVHSGHIIKEANIPNFTHLKSKIYEKRVAVKTIPYKNDYKIKASEIKEIEKEIMFLEQLEDFKAFVNLLGYSHSEKGGVYHLIFEYFETDFQKYLRYLYSEGNELNIKEKIKIINQYVAILSFLQKKGILHRDLKPKNFLLNTNRTKIIDREIDLKICDFGVALYSEEMNTETFTLAGTKHFLAPEYRELMQKKTDGDEIKEKDVKQNQISEEKTITITDIFDVKCSSSFKSDVFSLGLNMLYLFGFEIIKCNKDENYLKRVIETVEMEGIVTPEIVSILKKCLMWDRDSRPDFIFLEDYFLYVLHCPFSCIFPFDWTNEKRIYVSKENFGEIQNISDKDQIFKYFVDNGWKSIRISSNFLEIMYLASTKYIKFPKEILSAIQNSLTNTFQYELILEEDNMALNNPFTALCKCYSIENGENSLYYYLNKNIGYDRIDGELSRVFIINYLKYIPKSLECSPEVNVVYRGLSTSNYNHNNAFKLRSEYIPGVCLYWTAFISTSKNEEVALNNFTFKNAKDEGILFVIKLKNKKRVYDIQKFSDFESEAEVLLSPYFYFQVVSNEPFCINGRNICRITIEEKDDKFLKFKILRVDANIKNHDNKALTYEIKNLNIDIIEFENLDTSLEYVEKSKDLNLFVLSSGSIGKTFLPKLNDYDNVVGLGVYCWDVELHKAWANKQNLSKLVFLTSSAEGIIDFLKLYKSY